MLDKYSKIPAELKILNRWCVCHAVKRPLYLKNGILAYAKSNDPATWMDYAKAVELACDRNMHLGFMITADDDYVVIDCDVINKASQERKKQEIDKSKWTSYRQIQWYSHLALEARSYAERSLNGQGYHIWLKSELHKKTTQQNNVDIFCNNHFIVITGVAVSDVTSIEYNPDFIDKVISKIKNSNFETTTEKEVLDHVILQKIKDVPKFDLLWAGDYAAAGFPSASEADMALIALLFSNSPDKKQCQRIFNQSKLGQRAKAQRADYFDRTWNKIKYDWDSVDNLVNSILDTVIIDDKLIEEESSIPEIECPPGNAGKLCEYIYSISPRPILEVSVITTIGMLAGICGMTYGFPQTGCNLYLMLVAKSGIGKEAIITSMSNILYQLDQMDYGDPDLTGEVRKFVDFSNFASGQALTKAVLSQRSFVNVIGELGRRISQMAEDHAHPGKAELRTEITNLYTKSSRSAIVGGIKYSDKEKSTGSVYGTAYSLIGESTPDTFYQSLTQSMVADGFLSRFIIIEYHGDRPPLNLDLEKDMSNDLADILFKLCKHSMLMLSRNSTVAVEMTPIAKKVYMEFEKECTRNLNLSDDDAIRQTWNRADIKVLRLCGLLSAMDNPLFPLVTQTHIEWAIKFVRHDICNMIKRVASGAVGLSDDAGMRALIDILREYVDNKNLPSSYKLDDDLQKKQIVPKSYLYVRATKRACFYKHRLGTIKSLDLVIDTLINHGVLVEISKTYMKREFNKTFIAYKIVMLNSHL